MALHGIIHSIVLLVSGRWGDQIKVTSLSSLTRPIHILNNVLEQKKKNKTKDKKTSSSENPCRRYFPVDFDSHSHSLVFFLLMN